MFSTMLEALIASSARHYVLHKTEWTKEALDASLDVLKIYNVTHGTTYKDWARTKEGS